MNAKPTLARRALQVGVILFAIGMASAHVIRWQRRADVALMQGTKSTRVLDDLRMVDSPRPLTSAEILGASPLLDPIVWPRTRSVPELARNAAVSLSLTDSVFSTEQDELRKLVAGDSNASSQPPPIFGSWTGDGLGDRLSRVFDIDSTVMFTRDPATLEPLILSEAQQLVNVYKRITVITTSKSGPIIPAPLPPQPAVPLTKGLRPSPQVTLETSPPGKKSGQRSFLIPSSKSFTGVSSSELLNAIPSQPITPRYGASLETEAARTKPTLTNTPNPAMNSLPRRFLVPSSKWFSFDFQAPWLFDEPILSRPNMLRFDLPRELGRVPPNTLPPGRDEDPTLTLTIGSSKSSFIFQPPPLISPSNPPLKDRVRPNVSPSGLLPGSQPIDPLKEP